MKDMILNIFRCREFIISCVRREFQEKYTGSVLGVLWTVFQPLAMIVVYTVVFSSVMRNKLHGMEMLPFAYSIYLCSGVVAWNLFNDTLNSCVNVFLNNANVMKKVSFPRICLPVISVCSAMLNFLIGYGLFLGFLLLVGYFPWQVFLFVIPVLLVQTLFTATLGIGLGVLNVFFRDVGQMLTVILQFWFWFTPVVYPASIIPERLQSLMYLNPMYSLIHAYQEIFVYQRIPSLLPVVAVAVLSLLLGAWALQLFRKHVGEMVDEL